MKLNRSISDEAAENYLAAVRQREPGVYEALSRRIVQRNSMAGMGQGEDASVWDSITTGFGDLLTEGTQYYLDREQAKDAAEREAAAAARELERLQAQAALQLAQEQNAATRLELERQLAQAEIDKQKVEDISGYKKIAMIGGVILIAALVYSAVK